MVTPIHPDRRLEVVIDAAGAAHRRNPHVKVLVLGSGPRKAELLDHPVWQRGLEDVVIAAGPAGEDIREVLSALDAGLVLVPGSDGPCPAALRMAAMGKPLVVAPRGLLPEIVIDGQTGIVVDDTPENLAEALLEMAESAERRRQWGQAARRRIEEHFSPARQVSEVEAVYARLVGSQGS
jgi:glycosyltransferase involved in cell wall biosynthesis